ncbi:MAG: hypothetical protein GC159_09215 [Phycisphaera sp.]|nr:hypothetical protein [Phycisphaera sp.]
MTIHRACLSLAIVAATALTLAAPARAQLQDPLKAPADPTKPKADTPKVDVEGLEQTLTLDQIESIERRLTEAMAKPAPETDEAEVRGKLEGLIRDAAGLAKLTGPGTLRLQAWNIELQALYLRMVRWPRDAAFDAYHRRLRDVAGQARQIKLPDADALGDFWLMTADLIEVNRSDHALKEKQKRVQKLLTTYLTEHPDGPSAAACKQALSDLFRATTGTTAPAATVTEDDPGRSEDALAVLNAPPYKLGKKTIGADGVIRYPITSRYQVGENTLRILLPDNFNLLVPQPERRLTVLYVLPVEAGLGDQFGDGLEVIRSLNLHNKLDLVVVAPSFQNVPWYADNPTNPRVRQESFFVKGVVPAVDELLPGKEPKRLLLGFSKSGWGAFSLLCQYPDLFAAAAAWDAPLTLSSPDRFEMDKIFGTQHNFDRYALPNQFRTKQRILSREARFALLGYDFFRPQMTEAHQLLNSLKIPHLWNDGPQRRHRWDSGWVPEAITALLKMTGTE